MFVLVDYFVKRIILPRKNAFNQENEAIVAFEAQHKGKHKNTTRTQCYNIVILLAIIARSYVTI